MSIIRRRRVARNIGTTSSVRAAALLALLLVPTCSTYASAQSTWPWSYVEVVPPTTPAPDGFLTVQAPTACTDSSQTLPSTGYLKAATPVTIDTAVTNTGKCDAYLFGSYNQREFHAVNLIWYFINYPSGGSSYDRFWGSQWPFPSPMSYDSRTPFYGSGSKTEYGLYQLGQYQLGFQTNALATGCGFPVDSAITWKPVNVVSCKPGFTQAGNGSITRLPAGTIHIYVPSTMSYLYGPVDDAAADWSTLLAESGITLTRDLTSPCTTGGNCINVAEASIPAGACAAYEKYPDPTTSINALPAAIQFPSGANTRTADRLRRSVAHELGHLLGLADQTCGAYDSVMATAVVECTATSGFSVVPGPNDSLPANKTSYGNGSKISCGFP